MSGNGWSASLNGAVVCGGQCEDAVACLKVPPTGLDLPPLRVEDQVYPQRDGVDHFADWYEARIVTMEAAVGDDAACGCSGSTKANASTLMQAWKRECDDVELVLTREAEDCTPLAAAFNGTFDAGIDTWENILNTSLGWNISVYRTNPGSLLAVATGGVAGGFGLGDYAAFPVVQGAEYDLTAYMRAFSTTRNWRMTIVWFDAFGVQIDASTGPSLADSNSTWVEYTHTATAPTLATSATIRVATTATMTINEEHYFDDFSLTYRDRELDGPFGVVGRPRVANLNWRRGKAMVGDALLRFDGRDHLMYVLGDTGFPGSGAQCVRLASPPAADLSLYASAVQSLDPDITRLYPLDFPRLGPFVRDSGVGDHQVPKDIIGTDAGDAYLYGGFDYTKNLPATQAPALNYSLSLSSIQGPATLQTSPLPSSYTTGMFGWWQQTPSGAVPCGAILRLSSVHTFGQNAAGLPSPEIRWNGTNVAMNAATQAAFGFTSSLDFHNVLIVITWTAATVNIYAGHDASGATKLIQTVSVGNKPVSTAPVMLIYGQVSDVMQGTGTAIDGESIVDNLVSFGIGDPLSAIRIPDYGTECSPIQVTLEPGVGGTFSDVYIFREDGSWTGIEAGATGGDNAYSLDTESGTATKDYGLTDATGRIIGDPFLTVTPGEVLNIFGASGGPSPSITLCYRPAVISA